MLSEEMKVTYIDPDRRALYAAALPDGGYGVWAQKDKEAPRRLISKGYIKPEGYPTFGEAQQALSLYVSNKRESGSWARWDVFVNGKSATFDEMHAMARGELAAPSSVAPAAAVTLANIEYRIATHIQGAYENILEVGRCLNEAKDAGLVPHGQWEEWVRANTGMSERSAQKLMQAARCVSSGSMMNRLPISKIQAILTLPEPEREPMAEKAASEDMSLRKLQEAVKREKQRADQLAAINEKTCAEAAKARENAALYKQAQQKSEARVAEIARQLREAQQAAPAVGISPEAQAEIDRLKADLADAEAYAEQQAELRQSAQQELLNQRAQAVRGEGAPEITFGTAELAAAVRAFVGAVGVLPHLGASVAQISEGERAQMRQYIDMVDTWVEGARRALATVIIGNGEV